MNNLKNRAACAGLVAVSAFGLSACSSGSSMGSQATQNGINSGAGPVEMLAAAKRQGPVQLSGTTMDGKQWNVTSARGKVVVLNVWGAWCGPCQAEMPQLQKAWQSYASKKSAVQFIGIDQRDTTVVASSTMKKWGITYPSLQDDGGQNLQGLQRKVVATPTTLVLDKQGRIAGRVSGTTTAITVQTMVNQILAEKA